MRRLVLSALQQTIEGRSLSLMPPEGPEQEIFTELPLLPVSEGFDEPPIEDHWIVIPAAIEELIA